MKKYLFIAIILSSFLSNSSFGQKTRIGSLDKQLNEISGLAFINDSIIVGHNDSGDAPKLYFMNLKGKIKHTCLITNAKNIDWEDITYDGSKYLYIADFGNNDNNRKDLVVYKVNAIEALENKQSTAEEIKFKYAEQNAFPPSKDMLLFDAEGIAYSNNELYIFTKCRAQPYSGVSYFYKLPTKPGDYILTKSYEISLGKDGWWKDSNTAAEFYNGLFYLLTYNRLVVMKLNDTGFEQVNEYIMEPISQFEAIAINKKGEIVLADEENTLLGGGNIYQVKFPKKESK